MKTFLFVLCLMVAGSATADEVSARSCTGIVDNMARLACYDAAFGANTVAASHPAASAAAPSASQALPASPPPISWKTPEDAFGDIGNLKAQGSQRPTPPKRLVATVLNAVPLPQGLFRLTLDNGQIWETNQADWAVDFKSSNSVTIYRMTFGNYLISLTGQGRTVAVKRIQ